MGAVADKWDPQAEVVPLPVVGTLDELLEVFRGWLYLPDARSVEVSLATYVAHQRPGEPLWVHLVGASGGGKTEPIRALAAMPDAYMLSKLTPQTFISGLSGKPRASLLTRLKEDDKSFIIMKDFTSILSMNRDNQRELLADLREIYDGEIHKDFGSAVSEHWKGRLGLLCGVTPAMDTARKVNEIMGERFLYYRLPDADRQLLVTKALKGRGLEDQMRDELSGAVVAFLSVLDFTRDVKMSEQSIDRLLALADITTVGRSHVDRDRNHEMLTVPVPEAPTRFVKQLGATTEALMVLGRSEDAALSLVEKISLDSIPPVRLECLKHLIGQTEPVRTPEVANATHLPVSTIRLVLEDLTALRLADRHGSEQDLRWTLTESTRVLWKAAGIGGRMVKEEPKEEPEVEPKQEPFVTTSSPTDVMIARLDKERRKAG